MFISLDSFFSFTSELLYFPWNVHITPCFMFIIFYEQYRKFKVKSWLAGY